MRIKSLISTSCMKEPQPRGGLFRAFASDRRGNIAMLFAFMSGVLFFFVGGAVDYARWNSIRADMLESMDAATLAVAQLADDDDTLTDQQLKDFGYQFFIENFKYETILNAGWDIDFDIQSGGNIETCVNADIKTLLLGVAKIKKLGVDKCIEITPQGAGRVELALVLDVTGSMGWTDGSGQVKLTGLKDAVDELLDVLFEDQTESNNVLIGVVPFNTHVNAGGASSWSDADWGDINAKSYYHGYRFLHVDDTGTVQAGTHVNHYDLYRSDPDRSWEGCVEARPYPLDEIDTEPGVAQSSSVITAAMTAPSYADEPDSRVRDAYTFMPSLPHSMTATMLASADNSRFVPIFLPDDPECDDSGECEKQEWVEETREVCGWHRGRYRCREETDWVLQMMTGTTSLGTYWEGDWFTDPDDDPVLTYVRESSYTNDDYIDDVDFTGVASGTYFDHYVEVVDHFRKVIDGTESDFNFSNWLGRFGVTSKEQEYIIRSSYVGWHDSSGDSYNYRFELPKNSWSEGPNPGDCPPAILPLTNKRSDVETKMSSLVANGGTNIPGGAIWGWRVVSPRAPFTEAVGPGEAGPGNSSEADWIKAVVIMTDGENDFSDLSTHWGSYHTAYGFAHEERMGDGVDEADGGSGDMEDQADSKLLRICNNMKKDDILVYAIVFDVSAGSNVENIFKSCATDDDAPYFFNANDGADLEEAFGDIADDLVKLHVSR